MSENPDFSLLPPRHVAIVMDGNGRWAERNRVPTIAGHRAGAENVRKIVHHAAEVGIDYLTLYTFSSENWLRPREWVDDLMTLLRYYLRSHLSDLAENGVRLKVIGDRTKFADDIISLIEESEAKTANNDRITLLMALSYGGRDEIIMATKNIAKQVKAGNLSVEEVTAEVFAKNLYTAGIPDPDLLIRTSGEMRFSNFLLWQLAYTEFVFTPTLWPDFSPAEFDEAITTFQRRDRRYGNTIAAQP
jgi:undecaprenyl diphosphate synthase